MATTGMTLNDLLDDPDITQIVINGPGQVSIRRGAGLEAAPVRFGGEADLLRAVGALLNMEADAPGGLPPEAHLAGGWHMEIAMPPAAPDGPVIILRRLPTPADAEQRLLAVGTLTPPLVEFLSACVTARLNLIVCGNSRPLTAALLSTLARYIPPGELVVSVEWQPTLRLDREHLIRLIYAPGDEETGQHAGMRELMWKAQRLNPDRLIVGELRGGEALDLLQAMMTGFDGSMGAVHASGARDVLGRLEMLCSASGAGYAVLHTRRLIDGAVKLIVSVQRLGDGSERVTQVTEVQGISGDVNVLVDLFTFQQSGYAAGRIEGEIRPTGIRPQCMMRLDEAGIRLSPEIFRVPGRPGR